ncbi:MAG: GH36-type glycosyl hydrolase domain-containing protein [Rhodanobacteraceae bacterium]
MPAAPCTPAGSVQLLGCGGYSVVVTAAGSGCSRWNGLAITRWHPADGDAQAGGYVYVRDVANGTTWSAAAAPCGGETRVWRDEAMLRAARCDGRITTTLEIAVDPGYPVEVRGIGLRNDGPVEREIELTSYEELVLGSAHADDAHPAYSKMFVETAIENGALLAWRRKKDPSEPDVWAAHALVVDGAESAERECETDRARFIGRDRSLARPAALADGRRLSGTVGTVLDPVFSLRASMVVGAGEIRRAAFVTAAAASREDVLALILRYLTPDACAAVFARARVAAPRALQAPGIDAATARDFRQLSGALVGTDFSWRAGPAGGEGGAPVLWAKGISGDLPIVLVRIDNVGQLGLLDELRAAQRWWRARQLPVDIVVLDASDASEAIACADASGDKSQGSLFVLQEHALDARLHDGLYTAACITLDGRDGGLAAQCAVCSGGAEGSGVTVPPPAPVTARGGMPASTPTPADLDCWNGFGGFSKDGQEYVVMLREGTSTPVPWSHVVSNPDFGFLVTAAGGGYCWAVNSQQNPITPWSNDAARDAPGEVFLLRDADDGTEWSATAAPIRAGGAAYVARFGPGYARFDTNVHGIESELTQCVAVADPVKVSRLRLTNRSGRPRRIAIAQVVTWSLGPIGSDPRATTELEADPARAAVLARNAWRDEFAQANAFIACGTDGAVPRNDAHSRSAVVAEVELAPDASVDVRFLLGEGADRASARVLINRYRRIDFDDMLADVDASWNSVLGPLQVETPHHSIDLLVNRCLPYQVTACRLWARTAFYQASGAYGFRDQLQDVGALCIARPDLARAHILLAASRQFEEGDAQHWWLPPSGKGVRTRIVDDRLWLPLIVAHYVETVGDAAILDEHVPFLCGDALKPGQADSFFRPDASADSGSLFEHCARAIEVSLAVGVHGLPLMGTGDWNDGMNRVGAGGKGESAWMGWFLIRVIGDFAPFAETRRDPRASRWRDHARALELALETKAWDGGWYRRAYYDDGTPLGTSADTECRIESMAQSWAVISGRGDPERARIAMAAVNQYLVRGHDGLVALFAAPFDRAPHDPGYIKGYPPGLRENGGQYTHGSIWSLIAFAMLGDGDKAGELLELFDPVRKSDTFEKALRYKVEPYVECADVYSVAPHVGRGGWTWYSGSAGWLYRAIVEWVLGFRLRGDDLLMEPCIPRSWKGFALTYHRGGTTWLIEVDNPDGVCCGVATVELDGATLPDPHSGIPLADDGATHQVHVTLHEETP